jgi:hypothetical protein
MSLRASGNTVASKILKDISSAPRAEPIHIPKTKQLTPQEVLSMFIEADLTRIQYETIRKFDIDRFPCYTLLQAAKSECYPKRGAVSVTSNSAEVGLQALMDHSASRLCLYLTMKSLKDFHPKNYST